MHETDDTAAGRIYGYGFRIGRKLPIPPDDDALYGPPPDDDGEREFEVLDYIDPGWVIAYRIVEQDGAPVIAGVEIRPGGPPRPRAAAYGGNPATRPSDDDVPVPPGGLTARHVRAMRPGQALADARRRLHFLRDHHPIMLGDHRFGDDDPPKSGPRDWWYAQIAALYLDVIAGGSRRPRLEVAEKLGTSYSEKYVRDVLFKARERGILTGVGQGRVGGNLTDKGRRLLDGRA